MLQLIKKYFYQYALDYAIKKTGRPAISVAKFMLNTAESNLTKWQDGTVVPTAPTRQKLYEILGIPLDCYPIFDYKRFDELLHKRYPVAGNFAREADVSQKSVSCWRLGQKSPKPRELHKICKTFGCHERYLYHEKNEYVEKLRRIYELQMREAQESRG